MARTLSEDELEVEETSFEDQEEQVELNQEPIGMLSNFHSVAMTDTVPDELQNQRDVLDSQFAASEIGVTDYVKQRSAVDRQIISYQISEANSQNIYNGWMTAQVEFMAKNPHYTKNKILFEALAHAVKAIQDDVRSKHLAPNQLIHAADYLLKHSFDIALIGVNDADGDVRSKGLRRAQILRALKAADNLERDSFDIDEDVETDMEQKIWS